MPAPIVIATDGGCFPNPGNAGWAWVAEDGRYGAGAIEHGTNNLVELLAIGEALQQHAGLPLLIRADSQYAINCVTKWGRSWRQKGVTGKANQELILFIVDLIAEHGATVEFEWVRGHAGDRLNEAVDTIASRMSKIGAKHRELGVCDIDELAGGKAIRAPRRRSAAA